MELAELKRRLPNYRKYLAVFAVLWVIELVIMILLLSGTVRVECMGIRIDPAGNIYVGLTEEIRVFDKSGQLLRTISPKTSKNYVFHVDGDKLLLDSASSHYVMDLNGAVLEERSYSELPSFMQTPEKITVKGATYYFHCGFYYRVTIEDHGEKTVAVQMPTLDLIVKIAFFVMIAAIFVFVLTLLRKLKKQV
jgi:hypothetical protein